VKAVFEGDLYLATSEGTVRLYDRSGTRVGQWETALDDPLLAVSDPDTGMMALGGQNGTAPSSPPWYD
jgi:hypothetical protein